MKNIILVASAVLMFLYPSFAQFTAVNYDLERGWFNEGQALPAEKAMVIKAIPPQEVEAVKLTILSKKRNDVLYEAVWNRQNNNEMALLIPYKLRASDAYDFRWDFYTPLSVSEREQLKAQIAMTLNTYIDVNLSGQKQIKLQKSEKKMVKELDAILKDALEYYRTSVPDWKFAFSEVVRLKLEQLEDTDLDATFTKKDSTETRTEIRTATRTGLVADLRAQIENELELLMNTDFLVNTSSQTVDDYNTESKNGSLAVNVGYGGVYLSGEWDNFTYDDSPYVGLAFPLANSVLGSNFLSNASVTLGVFLNNFEDEDGNEITGLVVNRPIYLGLDYKLFEFVRFNAGATFLESNGNLGGANAGSNIIIRPYVGLSARFDLSVKMGK